MFEKEKDAMQGLGHHPHVVRLCCYSRMGRSCFLIMEKWMKTWLGFCSTGNCSRTALTFTYGKGCLDAGHFGRREVYIFTARVRRIAISNQGTSS